MLTPNYFDAFLADRRTDFCGRDWLFKYVADWAHANREKVLLIKGDPGTGKSAIVAQMKHRRRWPEVEPEVEILAWHCCQHNDLATRDPAELIVNLASIMMEPPGNIWANELDEDKAKEARSPSNAKANPVGAIRAGLWHPLQRLPAPANAAGKPVPRLLVIDALDEALPVSPTRGETTIVDVLLATLIDLPPWLRIVATTRREPDVLDCLRGFRAFELDAQEDPRRQDDDVEKYIRHRLQEKRLGAALVASGRTAAHVTAVLVKKSAGNFLFLKQAFEGIAAGAYTFDRLEEIPKGLDGIYRGYFQRRFPDHHPNPKKSPHRAVWAVLQVIVAAREPLSEEQIAQVAGICDPDDLREVFRLLGPLVPRRQGTYAVYHKSVADWLTSAERNDRFFVDPVEGHRKLAELCWREYRQAPRALSAYALAHLPHHLAGSRRWDDLVTVLTTPDFPEAKCAAGKVADLAGDYTVAAEKLPEGNPYARLLRLMDEAIRTDMPFLNRNPQTLFQCLWNRCWWYDCPEAAAHYELDGEATGPLPWEQPEPRLAMIMKLWRRVKERDPAFRWLRCLRPPQFPLGSALRTLIEVGSHVHGVAWSPDGRLVSATDENTVRIWDAATGHEVLRLEGHTEPVKKVTWSPDSKHMASASNDRTVRIWATATGRQMQVLAGHMDEVKVVAWSPDGQQVVSGSHDQTVRIWNVGTDQEVQVLHGHTKEVRAVAWSPDGCRVASGSWDQTMRIWDLATEMEKVLCRHTNYVHAVAWSPDSRQVVSGDASGTVRIWDTATGEGVNVLAGHKAWVKAVAWSQRAPQHIASCSDDQTVRLWDVVTGEVKVLRGHIHQVLDVAWSPDGQQVVSGSDDGTVRIWDTATKRQVHVLRSHTDEVLEVALSPDGRRVVSSSHDKTVRIWDVATGLPLQELRGHEQGVQTVAWSPDGFRVVSGCDGGKVRIWDVATGEVKELLGHTGSVKVVVWSPNGQQVVSGSEDRTLRIWDAGTGTVTGLYGHASHVLAVAWSRDGRQVVSGSDDQTARIWDAATGQELQKLEGDHDVAAIAASLEHNDPTNSADVASPGLSCQAAMTAPDTIIKSIATGELVAWFPALDKRTMHRSGLMWVVLMGRSHVTLVALEPDWTRWLEQQSASIEPGL